jgi:hypothetical protein
VPTYQLAALRDEAVDRLDALSQQFDDNQAEHNARLCIALGEPDKVKLSQAVIDAEVEFSESPSDDVYGEILNEVGKLEAVADRLTELDVSHKSKTPHATTRLRGWSDEIRNAVAEAQRRA